jgi:hypothetical protein
MLYQTTRFSVSLKTVKTITVCLVALFIHSMVSAQDIIQTSLDIAVAEKMLNANDTKSANNTDVVTLQKQFTKIGFKSVGINIEGTSRFTGKDGNGAFTIDFATRTYKKGAATIEVTTVLLKQGKTTETYTWAQDESSVYNMSNGTVAAKSASSVNAAIKVCLERHLSAGVQSCKECGDCVTNCIRTNSRFWAKFFCTFRCLGPCIRCGTNVVGFVGCMITAMKG